MLVRLGIVQLAEYLLGLLGSLGFDLWYCTGCGGAHL